MHLRYLCTSKCFEKTEKQTTNFAVTKLKVKNLQEWSLFTAGEHWKSETCSPLKFTPQTIANYVTYNTHSHQTGALT